MIVTVDHVIRLVSCYYPIIAIVSPPLDCEATCRRDAGSAHLISTLFSSLYLPRAGKTASLAGEPSASLNALAPSLPTNATDSLEYIKRGSVAADG